MFLPPGSESFNHNATRTTSSRSRSNNVNNNIVPVYKGRDTVGSQYTILEQGIWRTEPSDTATIMNIPRQFYWR